MLVATTTRHGRTSHDMVWPGFETPTSENPGG